MWSPVRNCPVSLPAQMVDATSARYAATGLTCGDGAGANQQCLIVPDTTVGGQPFGLPGEINQLNSPRTFQFAFRYRF
jgi:hypothetical protein